MARSLRKRNKSTLRKKRVPKQRLSKKKYSSLRKSVKKQRRKYRKRTPKKTRKNLSGGDGKEHLGEILQSFNSKNFSTDYTADGIDLKKWKKTSDNIHEYKVPKGTEKWGPDNTQNADEIIGNFIVIQMDGIYNPTTLKYKTIMMDKVLHEKFKIYCKNSGFTYVAEQLKKAAGENIDVFFVKKLPVRFFYEFQKLAVNSDATYNDIIPGAYDITYDPTGAHSVNVFTKKSNGEYYNSPLGGKFTMFFEKNCLENQLCSAFTGFTFRTNILNIPSPDAPQGEKRDVAQVWAIDVQKKIPALLFNAKEDAFYIDMKKFNDLEDNKKIVIFIYEWANVIANLIIKFNNDVNVDNINDEFKAWLDYCMRSSPPPEILFQAPEIRVNVEKILAGTHGYRLSSDNKNIEITELESPLKPDDGGDVPGAEEAAKTANTAAPGTTPAAVAANTAAPGASSSKPAATATGAASAKPAATATGVAANTAAPGASSSKPAATATGAASAKPAAAAEAVGDGEDLPQLPQAEAAAKPAAEAEAAGDGVPKDVKDNFTLILQNFNLYLIDSVCRYLLNFGLPKDNEELVETINKIYDMIITSVFVETFFDYLQENKITSGNVVSFKDIYTRSNLDVAPMAGGDSKDMFDSLQDNIFGENYYPKNTIINYILDKIEEEGGAGLITLKGGSISSRDFE